MTERAHQYVAEAERKKNAEHLRQLEASLSLDGDPRTEACLRKLREHYDAFQTKVKDGKISVAAYQVMSQVEALFEVSMDQLRRSLQLWEEAHQLRGDEREQVLQERESLVNEVVETTKHVNSAVEQFRKINARRDNTDLAELRDQLDESLRVAKRTEERMAEWDQQ